MKNKTKKRIWLRLKYPKFTLLILTILAAYFLFKGKGFLGLQSLLSSLGYLGSFIAGAFFTYGFTSAPATAIFLILGETTGLNIFLMALFGGLGALLGDFIIFEFIRTSFDDEIKKLEKEKIVRKAEKFIPLKLRHYLVPLIGGLIIASPLPDEIGVSMLAVVKRIKPSIFAIISYVMNTLGILVILLIGRAV